MINLSSKVKFILLFIFLASSFIAIAQEGNYNPGSKYTIEEIKVSGNESFNEQTIITFSGLRKGQNIIIPGEKTSNAIKKLWNSKTI